MKRIITTIICGIVAFIITFFNVFGTIDKGVEDVLYHNADTVSSKIRIIKIDDKTMNQLGEHADWDRSIYGKLVEKLNVSEDVRPAVIGFDVLFGSEKDKAKDEYFAEACAKYDNVVCGFSYVFVKDLDTDKDGNKYENAMSVKDKVMPYPSLAAVTTQGFVNALMDDDDNHIRSALISFEEKDGTVTKSFNAAVYEKYMEFCGKKVNYPTDKKVMDFKYSGNAGDYENVSLCDVLDGKIPPEAFDNCIVLVGAYAPGMMDSYFVPVHRGQQMYGVEIHANVIQAIMEGKTIDNVPKWVDCAIAVMTAFVLAYICYSTSVVKNIIICVAVIVIKLIAGKLLFNSGYSWNNLAVPFIALLITIYYIVLHYYKANAAKRSIEKAFNKYVAPQVVSELTTNCIFKHGGTLDKFIGDATMAVFNAPFDAEDYVFKAVLAAWDIVQGGNQIEEKFVEKYGKSVGFGVGVNCGPAVVGNIGCNFRMDYTAIGDTVNTAARLEANAPKGTVYISDMVYEQVKDRITVDEIGEIPLKGKAKGVFVYSVTGVKDYDGEAVESSLKSFTE